MNSPLTVTYFTNYCQIEVPINDKHTTVQYEIYGDSGYKLFGNITGELVFTNKQYIIIPDSNSESIFYKITVDDKKYTSFIKMNLMVD